MLIRLLAEMSGRQTISHDAPNVCSLDAIGSRGRELAYRVCHVVDNKCGMSPASRV